MQTFENLFSKTTQQNSLILHTNSPWVCVIKVCSNDGSTYIIREIIAKDNLNIADLMQTFELTFFFKTSLQNSLILHTNIPWVCVIKVCSIDGSTCIISEIIAKDNLNISNLMQIFENHLLFLNYSTDLFDIENKYSLDMCLFKWLHHLYYW